MMRNEWLQKSSLVIFLVNFPGFNQRKSSCHGQNVLKKFKKSKYKSKITTNNIKWLQGQDYTRPLSLQTTGMPLQADVGSNAIQ